MTINHYNQFATATLTLLLKQKLNYALCIKLVDILRVTGREESDN